MCPDHSSPFLTQRSVLQVVVENAGMLQTSVQDSGTLQNVIPEGTVTVAQEGRGSLFVCDNKS